MKWRDIIVLHPVFIEGDLIDKFRDHLLQYPYYHVIHEGLTDLGCLIKRFSNIEADGIINSFKKSDFPLACHLGSKSTEKFFDYHIALRYGNDKKEVFVYELVVREEKEKNIINGLLMAFYLLTISRYGIEKMLIPYNLTSLGTIDDINVESISNNLTLLTLKK
ncbi:hypothetical protein J2T12_005486 [Paenibacillus anaericanus]|nr:hypothetical protein [Paenibacillus anaericanus]